MTPSVRGVGLHWAWALTIQEAVLALEALDGVQPTSERALREVVWAADWAEQRERSIKQCDPSCPRSS